MQPDPDLERHRCEVRQLLRWWREYGGEWVAHWLHAAGKSRGENAARRLLDDARAQRQLGNRGEPGDWRD